MINFNFAASSAAALIRLPLLSGRNFRSMVIACTTTTLRSVLLNNSNAGAKSPGFKIQRFHLNTLYFLCLFFLICNDLNYLVNWRWLFTIDLTLFAYLPELGREVKQKNKGTRYQILTEILLPSFEIRHKWTYSPFLTTVHGYPDSFVGQLLQKCIKNLFIIAGWKLTWNTLKHTHTHTHTPERTQQTNV